MKIGNFLNKVRNTPPAQAFCLPRALRGGARRGAAMTRGSGKRAVIGAALLIIALAGVAALASFDSRGIAAAQATTDYDDDDDGLIDVTTLAQLNAIRHDTNGNGDATHADYVAAFPNRDTNATTRMGCPSGTCTGYELRADLDFDTDDDGDVDANDSPSFPNWTPIGTYLAPYTAEFKGNNRTISNLTMTGNSSLFRFGLFGTLSSSGLITGVGVVDANVNITTLPAPASCPCRAAALVGWSEGTIRSSYSTGAVSVSASTAALEAGGLVGVNTGGTIAASWSDADVSVTGSQVSNAGGLVGAIYADSGTGNAYVIASYASGSVSHSNTRAGGLVGYTIAAATTTWDITASYAFGPVSASGGSGGGLIGLSGTRGSATASYWDTATTGIADDADSTEDEGKTTRELQSPRPYTGIYSTWNVNVDGAAGSDDPWDFGQGMQYPMLKWDGMSLPAQGSLAMGMPDVDTNGETPTVGRMARVCLTTGPVLRAPRTGNPSLPARWVWSRSADGATWTDIADDGGGTYEYTPVAADVNNYLRACVAIRSTDARTRGESMTCIRPFPPVQASN